MAEYETIIAARQGDVLVLTLNRPDRLNAASLQMADDIAAALYDLDGARAVLVTGAGRAFCSGADLRSRGDASITGGNNYYHALLRHYNPTMLALAELNVPIVTAVNGPAAGIGCSIALAADFTLMGRSAYLLQAFVNIGLVPDGGASWMLARSIGTARATQMMMLGEKIGADQAYEWGLIYKALDDAALFDEALALTTRLAAGPTLALRVMRANLREALDGTFAQALMREASGQRIAGFSADATEGAASFIEKRKPVFKGK